MKRPSKSSRPPDALRARSERWLRQTRSDIARLVPEDVQKLVHELQVHQIELEMQNEELRQSQLELTQARDRYVDLFDFSPFTHLTMDAAGVILEANLSAAKLLGLERGRLIRQKLTRFIAPESQDTFYLLCRRVFRSNHWQDVDLVLRTAADKRLVVHINAVRDPKFPRERCRVCLTDITISEQRAANLLQLSQRNYRRLFENLTDAFVSVSMSGRLQEFNSAYRDMLGYTDKELLRLSYTDLTPKKWHTIEAAIVREQILPCGHSEVYEKEYRRKDGTIFPVELRTFLIKNPAGKPEGMWAIIRDITGRKRDQEALRKSEERFRAIMDLSPDIISIFDPEGRLIFNSAAAGKIHGYSTANMEGRSTFDLIHPEDRRDVERAFARLLQAKINEVQVQYRYRNADGCYKWMEAIARNELANPMINGVIAISRDITARRQAEEKIRQLNKTLEQRVRERTTELTRTNLALQLEKSFSERIIATAQTIILVLDRKARIVRFNPFLEEISGYRLEEVMGKNWFEVFLPETDWRRIRKVFLKTIAGQPPPGTINAIRLKDGTSRMIEWSNSPIQNDRGRVAGLLAVGVDITERQRAEEKLRKSEERYRLLFTASRDALLTLAPPMWNFTACNPAAVEMFRARDASQVLAAAPWEVSPAFQPNGIPSLAAAKACIDAALRQGSHVFEWRHRRFGGEEFPASVLLTRIEMEGRIFLQATVRDITERVRLEQEVLNVGERESRRIAGDLHDGLGQVLFGASCLAKSLQLDLDKKSLPEAEDMARIQQLINGALVHARKLAKGLHPVDPEPNGLMVALEDLSETSRQIFKLRCDFECKKPVMLYDNSVATHLFRIAQESVTNAAKHGRAKRVWIRLTRSDGQVTLVVKDDGVGLSTKTQKKTGMGLSIMRYRAGKIGALLTIQNAGAGGGTLVKCRVNDSHD